MNSKKNHRFFKVATIILVVATVLVAVYIMFNGLGLVDGLDFGAGAYFTPISLIMRKLMLTDVLSQEFQDGFISYCFSSGAR